MEFEELVKTKIWFIDSLIAKYGEESMMWNSHFTLDESISSKEYAKFCYNKSGCIPFYISISLSDIEFDIDRFSECFVMSDEVTDKSPMRDFVNDLFTCHIRVLHQGKVLTKICFIGRNGNVKRKLTCYHGFLSLFSFLYRSTENVFPPIRSLEEKG